MHQYWKKMRGFNGYVMPRFPFFDLYVYYSAIEGGWRHNRSNEAFNSAEEASEDCIKETKEWLQRTKDPILTVQLTGNIGYGKYKNIYFSYEGRFEETYIWVVGGQIRTSSSNAPSNRFGIRFLSTEPPEVPETFAQKIEKRHKDRFFRVFGQ